MFHKILIFLCLSLAVSDVLGHGMLFFPLQRNSLWRSEFGAPVDLKDNETWCGSPSVQYGLNNGKCGVCGDSYNMPRPRPSENGGLYGKGNVVAEYRSGSTISVTVVLTVNHLGSWKLGLCPLENPDALETEECFQTLPLVDGSIEYKISATDKVVTNHVVLPEGLSCARCVLRWDWVGADQPVNQQQFRGCSDIRIV